MANLDESTATAIGNKKDFLDPEDAISPLQKRRNFLLKRATYEFVHFLAVVATCLSIHTRKHLGTEYCHGVRSFENQTMTSSFSLMCINEHFDEVTVTACLKYLQMRAHALQNVKTHAHT